MKKLFLCLCIISISSLVSGQIEWVSDDYSSEYPDQLFKTKTDQFILLHGEFEYYPTKMSVFNSDGEVIYSLDANETGNTFQISSYKDIMHLPDSTVAIILENWSMNPTSGETSFYDSILKFDKDWNPTQIQGMAFAVQDVGAVASDGSFIVMSTSNSGIARIAPEGGWTWAEWLNTTCYDLLVHSGDSIIIATENGLVMMDINGNTIGESPDFIFTKIKAAENGNIVGVNENHISIISAAQALLFEYTIAEGNVEDFYLQGDSIAVLTESNHVYLFDDALNLLTSFEVYNDGQFDFISLNNENIILAGMERYGGEGAYYQTRATFLKEYSLLGDDFGISHDIGIEAVGQPSEIEVIQLGPDTYRILFKDIPLSIKNYGDQPVNNLMLKSYINSPRIVTDFSLQPGETKEFIWDEIRRPAYLEDPSGNTYNLCFWTARPDNRMDLDAENDFLCSDFLVTDIETLNDGGISIFPNPVTGGYLHLEGIDHQTNPSIKNILLFDATGRKVTERAFANVFDLSQLKPGFYLLKCFNSDNELVFSKKLILQR